MKRPKPLLGKISKRDWYMIGGAGFLTDHEKRKLLGLDKVLDKISTREK